MVQISLLDRMELQYSAGCTDFVEISAGASYTLLCPVRVGSGFELLQPSLPFVTVLRGRLEGMNLKIRESL